MGIDMNTGKNGEQAGQYSTKKKWLIGCGGCLVVVIVLTVIASILLGTAFKSLTEVSNESVKAVFGKEYQPPEGYMSIGLPAGQNELKNMVLLVHATRGIVIVGLDTLTTEQDTEILKHGTPREIEQYIREVGAKANKTTGKTTTKVDLDQVRFEAIQTITLPNQKKFPLIKAVMRMEKHSEETYSPTVITLLPTGENRMIVLFAMDAQSDSTDAQADFSVEHKRLEEELLRMITGSELDDKLTG